MHDVHKIDVYAMFTQITFKKGIKRNYIRELATIYNDYTHLEEMILMRTLNPDSITKSKKEEHCNKYTQ